jgi:hypothetical protein
MGQQGNPLLTTAMIGKVGDHHAVVGDPATDAQTKDIVETITMLSRLGVEQVAIVTITLYFHVDLQNYVDQHGIDESIAHYSSYLGEQIRFLDFILLHQQDNVGTSFNATYICHLYFLLAGVSNKGAAIIKDQLWETLLRRVRDDEIDAGVRRPEEMAAGYSAYPYPSETIAQSLEQACIELVRVQLIPDEPIQNGTDHKQVTLAQMAQDMGIPYLPFLPPRISTRLRRLVTPALAQELQCYPLGRERNTLTVAMVDPCDQQTLARLEHITGLHIFPVLADASELRVALERII